MSMAATKKAPTAQKTGSKGAPKSLDGKPSAPVGATLPLTTARRLDAMGIDAICAEIAGGTSQSQFARDNGIAPQTFVDWIAADAVRSARIREARSLSADAYADKAEDVLLGEDNPQMLPRARELASHYRWMASKRRPSEYGDKQVIDLNAQITITPEQLDANIQRLLAKASS